MKKLTRQFRVDPGDTVDLKQRPTLLDPVYANKREYQQHLASHVERMSKLQSLLYASNAHAVLVLFQGMDAAGKDSCIKHVMSGINPQGCQVYSFSHPSPHELKHDFLWRTTRDLPERGRIGIFNRSHYEDVLIVRVHPEILAAQSLPDDGKDDRIWAERYRSITGLERHLYGNGTRIVKIFLHISKDEQKKRLLDRIDTPEKNWKIAPSDIAERKHWKAYRKAYEEAMAATSTRDVPWHIVPADDKMSARLFVSHIILETLEGLNMQFPETTPERRAELLAMREHLAAD
ncbi:MAG: ADP-polyphosphate phosphotransferase [Hyphomicrobiaceae bacterium]